MRRSVDDIRESQNRIGCKAARAYEQKYPNPPPHDGYCMWPLLGDSKTQRRDDVMWHETHGPEEYYQQAMKWGITEYPPSAFNL